VDTINLSYRRLRCCGVHRRNGEWSCGERERERERCREPYGVLRLEGGRIGLDQFLAHTHTHTPHNTQHTHTHTTHTHHTHTHTHTNLPHSNPNYLPLFNSVAHPPPPKYCQVEKILGEHCHPLPPTRHAYGMLHNNIQKDSVYMLNGLYFDFCPRDYKVMLHPNTTTPTASTDRERKTVAPSVMSVTTLLTKHGTVTVWEGFVSIRM